MKLLPIVLFGAAAAVLLLALMRVRNLVMYNRKNRRRRRRRRLDPLTVLMFPAALALVIAAVLTLPGDVTPPQQETQPTTGTQEVTEPTTEPEPTGGWIELEGNRYHLDENGAYTVGWLDLDGKTYYFDESGVMALGWTEVEGTNYYFREDGSMARGEVAIDGVNYHFDSWGRRVILANPWNPVPADYTADFVTLSSKYAVDNSQVDRSCVDDLMQMIDDCNAVSPTAYVVSAYRDFDHQTRNYNRKVNYYLNKGYSQADAEKEAATVVAVPGTSEHQLGLAVDIIDTRLWDLVEAQENQPAQKWLLENSWRYGFIFRYPKDKIDITGIIYEPWHYRYVGRELAEEIHATGLTLEEYLASLS